SRQVDALDCAGLMVDYRNAPDHQHPVGRDDVEAVLGALAADGRLDGRRWALAGQHSGGGLAAVVARRLRGQDASAAPSAPAAAPRTPGPAPPRRPAGSTGGGGRSPVSPPAAPSPSSSPDGCASRTRSPPRRR